MSEAWADNYSLEAAVLSDRGYFTAKDLARLSSDEWLYLRNSISDGMQGAEGEVSAKCAYCAHPVYVHAPKLPGRPPFFQHRAGAPASCRWYTGNPRALDAIRAEKFNGAKESPLHREMCHLLFQLASQDPRYVDDSGMMGRYLRPLNEERGRYPDVYFRWGERKYALEFQLANSMQPEISGRELFYGREGVILIWIFGRFLADEVPRSGFIDIIHRHRGNAFVLDMAAVQMSRARKTLCLSVHMQNQAGGYDVKTVCLDDLQVPPKGLAFLEDRTIAPVLKEVEAKRLLLADHMFSTRDFYRLLPVSGLRVTEDEDGRRLVAVALSVWSAARGEFKNYLNAQPNLKGLLEAYFNSRDGKRNAELLWPLIASEKAKASAGPKLLAKIRSCLSDTEQYGPEGLEGDFLIEFFPELYDDPRRLRWKRADALPAWAK